jgi:hypothetical protein
MSLFCDWIGQTAVELLLISIGVTLTSRSPGQCPYSQEVTTEGLGLQ